ncbi:unnamed protein product [Cochlearia groenlandica]
MTTQNLNKSCKILVIAMFLGVIFTAQTSHSNTVNDVCIKRCIPNQCLNKVKDATQDVCENACKKLCNEQNVIGTQYFVRPKPPETETGVCKYIKGFGC